MNINCKINEYLNEYTKLWPFSGAIAVVIKGEVMFSKNYGMASIEHSVLNTTDTKYKIASLTKQITCMGIMILREKGLLSVSDKLKKFFPDYPEFDERITIHHLMTHTSGLCSEFSVVDPYLILGKRLYSHKEVLDLFRDMPMEFQPDQDWSYCYLGYYLLGLIIERVSGKSYIEFLKNNIFEPLGTWLSIKSTIFSWVALGTYFNTTCPSRSISPKTVFFGLYGLPSFLRLLFTKERLLG